MISLACRRKSLFFSRPIKELEVCSISLLTPSGLNQGRVEITWMNSSGSSSISRRSRPTLLTKRNRLHCKALSNALLNNKVIFVRYHSKNDPNAEKNRKIRPLCLCMHRDDLYFFGDEQSGDQWIRKHYKVVRVATIEDSIETFKYPAPMKWNPETEFAKASGLILGKAEPADIKVYSHFRGTLEEKNFMNAKLITRHEDHDEYEFSYTNVDEFLGRLATYAECVEIVRPPELKEAWELKLRRAIDRLGPPKKEKGRLETASDKNLFFNFY